MKNFIIFFVFILSLISKGYSEWQKANLDKSPVDPTNFSMNFTGIDCIDSLNCIAIANDASYYRVIYKSTDAGKNWHLSYNKDYGKKKDYPLFRSLSCLTNNRCIIGADSGVIFLYDNNGNFTRYNTPINSNPIKHPNFINISHINMYDTTFGLATTNFFMIYTKDGGENWELIKKPDSSCGIRCSAILSPNNFVIYGTCKNPNENCPYNRTIFISNDTGNSWTAYNFENIDGKQDSAGGIIKFCFIDSLNGWAIGGVPTGLGDTDTKKIAHTSDGGKSWILQYDSIAIPRFTLWDVSFHDVNNGIAVGRFGSVLLTNDGGLNWSNDSVDIIQSTYPPMLYTSYRNIDKPIIVDFGGRIFYEDGIVSVKEYQKKEYSIEIFPNPTQDYININITANYNSHFRIDDFKIFNIYGECIKNPKPVIPNGEGIIRLDVSDLSNGVYFINLGCLTNKFLIIK